MEPYTTPKVSSTPSLGQKISVNDGCTNGNSTTENAQEESSHFERKKRAKLLQYEIILK